jgi:hypothetical protein
MPSMRSYLEFVCQTAEACAARTMTPRSEPAYAPRVTLNATVSEADAALIRQAAKDRDITAAQLIRDSLAQHLQVRLTMPKTP